MPFIYIDSQSREVRIPSVDALRLRIELGAIKDDTQFHDANTAKTFNFLHGLLGIFDMPVAAYQFGSDIT